jgi:hypothetical protein
MTNRLLTPYCFATMAMAALFAQGAFADSFGNASAASADSAEASARLAASGVQVTMGAVAIPLTAVGGLTMEAGEATFDLGLDLWDAANAPLEVSDEVVTALPPPVLAGAAQADAE